MNNVIAMKTTDVLTITLEQAQALTYEQLLKLGRFAMRQLAQRLCGLEGDALVAYTNMTNDDQAANLMQILASKVPTFGGALAAAREQAKLTREELGALCDVTRRAVEKWECNDNYPVKEHYENLLRVLPSLKDAPEPKVRDIEPPVGRTAGEPGAAVDEVPAAPAQQTLNLPPPASSTPKEVAVTPVPPASPARSIQVESQADLLSRWTTAVDELKLSPAQASTLKTMVEVGPKLGLTLDSFTSTILKKWLT